MIVNRLRGGPRYSPWCTICRCHGSTCLLDPPKVAPASLAFHDLRISNVKFVNTRWNGAGSVSVKKEAPP